MLIAILVVVNIPLFLFLAWVIFDTKEKAADTFLETTIAVLKIIFIPRIVRALMGEDDSGALGLFPIAAFFVACGLIVYGEHYLIDKYLWPQ